LKDKEDAKIQLQHIRFIIIAITINVEVQFESEWKTSQIISAYI
jgi:hypothetical protein